MSDALDTEGSTDTETSLLTDAGGESAQGEGEAGAAKAEGEKKPAAEAKPDAKVETKVDEKKPDARVAAKPAEKTEEQKKAEAKAESDRITAAAAKLELKLPEGVDAKDATLGEFKQLAAKHGLDTAKAQELYDLHHKALSAASKGFTDTAVNEINTTRKGWVAELKGDKEFGGANFEKSKAEVAKVMAKYPIDEETRAFLRSGPGDHPGLFKLLARIGRDLREDSVAPAKGAKASTDSKPKPGSPEWLRAQYPNSPELFANT